MFMKEIWTSSGHWHVHFVNYKIQLKEVVLFIQKLINHYELIILAILINHGFLIFCLDGLTVWNCSNKYQEIVNNSNSQNY